MKTSRFTKRTLLLCSCIGLSGNAFAQSANEETGDPAKLDEIVVTAQRQEQRLQDVPVAITALNAVAIENHGVANVQDLQFQAPNMQIRSDRATSGITLGIRGINVDSSIFSFDSAVGVYVDEVYIARSNDANATFFDVQSVQVLRGPQGTMFGRNTPAGAVLVESTRPGDTFGGYMQASVGGGGHGIGQGADRTMYSFKGAIDIPVSPTLAIRVAGYYEKDDGWGRSRFSGYKFESRDDVGARVTLAFKPADNFDATLILNYSKTNHGVPLRVPVEVTFPQSAELYDTLYGGSLVKNDVARLAANVDPYANESEFTLEAATGKSRSAALQMNYDLSDDWKLRSISGWRSIKRFQLNDNDATRYFSSQTTSEIKQTQWSQELILNGDVGDRLHVLGGLFYFEESGFDQNVIRSTVRNPGTASAYVDPLFLQGNPIKNVSKAIFANVSYDILPNLTASAGYRYTWENKRTNVDSYYLVSGTVFAKSLDVFKDKVPLYDAKLTWKATPDLMLYAKYGTGYRAGGSSFRAANAVFGPERSQTMEAGFKWDFDLGAVPVRLNSAVFHTKYKDFQIGVTLSNPTRTTVINAGKATLNGIEAEFVIKPAEGFDLSASIGYLDAKYDSFVFENLSFGGIVDVTKNKLRQAPQFTSAVQAGYTVESSAGELRFQIDWAHQSSYFVDPIYQPTASRANLRTNAFFQKPSDMVNARIRLGQAFGSKIDVTLWGKNLTDQARKDYGLASGSTRQIGFSEPLSYGVDLRVNF